MSDEQVLRLLLMAIDSHELDGDEQKLKRAAAEARRLLGGDNYA